MFKIKKRKKSCDEIKPKKYEYHIVFKNGTRYDGECTSKSLYEVNELFLQDKFSHLLNSTKGCYFNSSEILIFEVTEKGE